MVNVRNVLPTFAANDMDAVREFYADTLGMSVSTLDEGAGIVLDLGDGAAVFVYQKDDHVPAPFTVMHLTVDDVDEVVDELAAKGVKFQHYEGFEQDEKGIVRGFMEGGDGAWFTDPAGNIIGLADGGGMEAFLENPGG